MVESVTSDRPVKPGRRKIVWSLLALVVAVAVATVFVPVWLIMPFKAQTSRGVAISYALKSWSPVITVLAVILALAATVWLWRGARWSGRTMMILILMPALVVAWFARQNHFEWMFNPLPDPAYLSVATLPSGGDSVKDREMVMSVVINGEAAAYPVRQMAYHHVVQDTVGGVPIVATY